jgi:hypothetical protein
MTWGELRDILREAEWPIAEVSLANGQFIYGEDIKIEGFGEIAQITAENITVMTRVSNITALTFKDPSKG